MATRKALGGAIAGLLHSTERYRTVICCGGTLHVEDEDGSWFQIQVIKANQSTHHVLASHASGGEPSRSSSSATTAEERGVGFLDWTDLAAVHSTTT